MSILALLKGKRGKTGFGFASTSDDVASDLDLKGKNILITGVNSGLGLDTARVLASKGAKIFGAARSDARANAAMANLPGKHIPLECELSEPQSIRNAVRSIQDNKEKLDVIVANAGIMSLPKLEQKYGYELQFFTNHIGHFILITKLLDSVKDGGRIVILSSSAHKMTYKEGIQFDNLSGENGYQAWGAYGQSKLANLLFARLLAEKLVSRRIVVNAVHPGVITTNLGRHMPGWQNAVFSSIGGMIGMKSIPQGAATQVFAAVHPKAVDMTGQYLYDCNIQKSTAHGENMEMATRLWQVSEQIAKDV